MSAKPAELPHEPLAAMIAGVTEAAARAAARHRGRGDERAADQAATEAMRSTLGRLPVSGRVVIGEGERDEAPMLWIGEELGRGGPELDIAVDPLEGTTLTARDLNDALTVIAVAPRGTLLQAPDVYMDKLAVGPGVPPDAVTLEMSPGERVIALAGALSRRPEDIRVLILDRPRHAAMIAEVREAGAAVRLISDGDIAGVMLTTEPERTGIDMYMGSGGAPEGVLAAAALASLGGHIQGRLLLRSEEDRARAARLGIRDPDRIYTGADMVRGEVVFAATGVTDGYLLRGVRQRRGHVETDTLLLSSADGCQRRILTRHRS